MRSRWTDRDSDYLHQVGVYGLAAAVIVIAIMLLALLAERVRGDEDWEDLGVWRVTAYCPCRVCCGRHADGITADGTRLAPSKKVLAAPRSIPFDTRLRVPGYGTARVADRGGAIKDRRLDVFFWRHQDALEWGVRWLKVERRR